LLFCFHIHMETTVTYLWPIRHNYGNLFNGL